MMNVLFSVDIYSREEFIQENLDFLVNEMINQANQADLNKLICDLNLLKLQSEILASIGY